MTSYQPFLIGKRFRITPQWMPPVPDRIDLITQRGAFGSGEHETTVSCLEIMAELDILKGTRVLDLGSGTGILAIAAVKLGAAAAVCVDIDPRAVATAQANCQANQVADRISHVAGTLDDLGETGFDLALANIYGDILLKVAEPLSGKVRKTGGLLLSGILWEDNFAVRQAYQKTGWALVTNRMLNEYSTLYLTK
ncbi:MAG: 50S ribosomal protein L11 methyltransferase [Desulfuromonadales bacterium]